MVIKKILATDHNPDPDNPHKENRMEKPAAVLT